MKEYEPYNFKCPACGARLLRNDEGLFVCAACRQVYQAGENGVVAGESRFYRKAMRKIIPEVYTLPFGYTVSVTKNKNRIFASLQKFGTIERYEENRAAFMPVSVNKDADFSTELRARRSAFAMYGNARKFEQECLPDRDGKSSCGCVFSAYAEKMTEDCAVTPVENYAEKLYYDGKALYDDKNYVAAVPQFRLAAEQGHVAAQYMMGVCCENGRGIAKNAIEAIEWYKSAADRHDCNALRRLGVCYENGVGVERDYAASAVWYRRAAELGDPDAQCLLGVCYQTGQGVARNSGLAAKWVRQSAAQGCAAGQACLGVFFEYGISPMPQDFAEAGKWYRRAAEQGNEDAKKRLTSLERKQKEQRQNRPPDWRAGEWGGSLYVNNSSFAPRTNIYGQKKKTREKDPVNWAVFVVLLIFFWPGAVIYLLATKGTRPVWIIILSIIVFMVMLFAIALNLNSCLNTVFDINLHL